VISRRIFVRALLTAAALVLIALPSVILAGAFLPGIPAVARFATVLQVGLPWVLGAVLAALAMAIAARVLGGGPLTATVLGLTILAAAGVSVVLVRFVAFAHDNDAAFDLGRTEAPDPAPRPADATFTFATEDPSVVLRAELWRVPAGAPAPAPRGRAAIVYVHGGGFVGGSLHMRPRLFEAWSAAGYPVLDVEYRLAPPPRWSDAPGDVLCGLVLLGTIAATEGIDANRVVIVGESAGGSLALLAAYGASYGPGADQLHSSCSGNPVVPAAVIAVAPAADLAGIWADHTLVGEGVPFPEAYVGGPPTQLADRYTAASPFRLIADGRSLPPTLIIAGENDHAILRPRTDSVVDALRAAGDDVTYLIVPYADHGFDGLPNGYGAQMEESIVPAFVARLTR